jgi:uncharacterized protein involved in response to NO
MATLIQIQSPPKRGQFRFALWDLGFRPFYLLASSFASLSILVWALQFSGLLPYAYLQGPMWHAHEMLFGFTLAVLTGFLLTAGQNWSGQSTPKGAYLGALAALWVAGRILVLSPWGWLAAGVNVAFPLAAATALAIPLYRARNRRNYFFVGLLLLMAVAQLGVHLDALGALRFPGWAGIGLGLDVMLFVLSVMAGRVIPMFTNNAIPGAKAVRHPWVEDLTVVVLVNGIDQGVDFFVAGLSAGSHLIQSGVDQIDDFVSVKCHTVISVELIEDGIDCGSEFLI